MKPQRNPALPGNLKNLNTRQRKKMRVGEFQELGFSLKAQFVAGLDIATQDALLDAWLTTVDQAGVSFGGQFDADGTLEGLVFQVSRVAVSEEVRSSLLAWLKSRAEVASMEASGLFDLWHTA
jgi:uncharacterized protein YggL (DUF469 family)